MSNTQPETIYLKDYQPAPYQIDELQLYFNLGEQETLVTSTLTMQRRGDNGAPLKLDGQALELVSIKRDGESLSADCYEIDEESLTISDLPDTFELEIQTRIKPQLNTSLEGLYKSSGNFCTQCEAEGFRKITYFYDRPLLMFLWLERVNSLLCAAAATPRVPWWMRLRVMSRKSHQSLRKRRLLP